MKKSIYDDLFRYTGKRSIRLLWKYVFFTPGFRYIYFLRKPSQLILLLLSSFGNFF